MSTDADVTPVPAGLLDNLALTSFTVIALLSRTAAEHDMSLTQFRMMAILRDRTPTMAELTGALTPAEQKRLTCLLGKMLAA
jgi:hypothetical protein